MTRHTRIFCSLRSFGSFFSSSFIWRKSSSFSIKTLQQYSSPNLLFSPFQFQAPLNDLPHQKLKGHLIQNTFFVPKILTKPHTLFFDSTCLFHSISLIGFPKPVPLLDSNLIKTLLLPWRLHSLYTFWLSIVSSLQTSLIHLPLCAAKPTILKFFFQHFKLPPRNTQIVSLISPMLSPWDVSFLQFVDSVQHLPLLVFNNRGLTTVQLFFISTLHGIKQKQRSIFCRDPMTQNIDGYRI